MEQKSNVAFTPEVVENPKAGQVKKDSMQQEDTQSVETTKANQKWAEGKRKQMKGDK